MIIFEKHQEGEDGYLSGILGVAYMYDIHARWALPDSYVDLLNIGFLACSKGSMLRFG